VKIATYRVGGERRVGIVDLVSQTVSPFDLPESEAAHGVLALIDRAVLPRILSPMPLGEAEIEAPIVRPRRNIFCVGKNYYEHAKGFKRRQWRRAQTSDHLFQSARMRHRP
jgi:2-keto-4-pentenoate hydratase/2-oxohepta-3-ene-1,7-dioic acid hydratase in catechol pathway